jgi:hypothetical protein
MAVTRDIIGEFSGGAEERLLRSIEPSIVRVRPYVAVRESHFWAFCLLLTLASFQVMSPRGI